MKRLLQTTSGEEYDYKEVLEPVIFVSLRESREMTTPRGGLPYKNDGGARRKCLKNTLKGTRILFDGCGSNDFYP